MSFFSRRKFLASIAGLFAGAVALKVVPQVEKPKALPARPLWGKSDFERLEVRMAEMETMAAKTAATQAGMDEMLAQLQEANIRGREA